MRQVEIVYMACSCGFYASLNLLSLFIRNGFKVPIRDGFHRLPRYVKGAPRLHFVVSATARVVHESRRGEQSAVIKNKYLALFISF